MSVPTVLSIAGSDCGGGAGIQADIKAFARCGAHGMTAITAITAQNTVAVKQVFELPREMIVEQVRAVVEDIGVDAVKVGMLWSLAVVEAVREALELIGDLPIVVDPVMVPESGARLLGEDAVELLKGAILPRSTMVTPNRAEALVLAGAPESISCEDLAAAIVALGPKHAIITGGDRSDGADLFFDGEKFEWIVGEHYAAAAAHGSGCTHSAVVAACLALGQSPLAAAHRARVIAGEAVRDRLAGVGAGAGPVDVLGGLRSIPPVA